jgi:hypothetical protein
LEFQKAVEKELALRRDKSQQLFDQEDIEKTMRLSDHDAPKPLVIEGDDQHQTQRWNSLLKASAYYYDNPSLD